MQDNTYPIYWEIVLGMKEPKCSLEWSPDSLSNLLILCLQKDGDLLSEELNEIWEGAPKFPDVKEDRIDVDSFVQSKLQYHMLNQRCDIVY